MRRSTGFLLFLLLACLPALCSAGRTREQAGLLHRIQVYIAKELQVSTADVEVQLLRTYPDSLEGGYKLLPMSSLPKRGGISTFPLDRNGSRGYMTVRFRVFYSVTVTRDVVKPGQPLDGEIAMERKDASLVPWDACRSLEEARGMESRVSMQAGQVLVPADFTPIKLVHQGDLCVVLVEKGRVEVQAQGQSLGDGSEGAVVPVRLFWNSKTIYAKVVKNGEVELDLPNL